MIYLNSGLSTLVAETTQNLRYHKHKAAVAVMPVVRYVHFVHEYTQNLTEGCSSSEAGFVI